MNSVFRLRLLLALAVLLTLWLPASLWAQKVIWIRVDTQDNCNPLSAYIDPGVSKINAVRAHGDAWHFAGLFDFVFIQDENYNYIASVPDINNVITLEGCAAYYLDVGYYQGSGNGVNGEVMALATNQAGDLYLGGAFTVAGGFPYSAKIGVYRASGGWQSTYIWSANADVTSLTWVSGYKLAVYGPNLTSVYGPLYQGDTSTNNIDVSSTNTGYWNDWYKTFMNGWWDQ